MKVLLILQFLLLASVFGFSQNQIRIRAGFLSSKTSIAEYNRDLNYFYLDSVTLDSRIISPTVNVDMDVDLGKGFFLSTGLGYAEKGIESVYYNNGGYWYSATQKYMGMAFQLKYHYKIKDQRLGFFAASGLKADFAFGGPNNAEVAIVDGSRFFQAFGSLSTVDFGLYSILGISYKIGPGDVILDVNFINGLSNTLKDQYLNGKSFSTGATLGYSVYL